jgi:O-antigen ligase
VALPAAVVVVALLAGGFAFGTAGDFLHGRASTWGAAVETFADRPLSGAGADAFLAGSIQHQDGQTTVFAHNLPLELAAELGLAGFALAIALYAATAALLWRTRATRAAALLGPAAAAFLVASLLDWPWHLAGSGAVFALSLGAMAGEPARARKFTPPNGIEGDS